MAHRDSHYSLIRWGFVLHGEIDGHSWLIKSLQCSTNNKAETAVSLLEQALEIYGVPSRVRTDKGGENTLILRKMIKLREKEHLLYIISGLNAYVEMPGIMFVASFIIFFRLWKLKISWIILKVI